MIRFYFISLSIWLLVGNLTTHAQGLSNTDEPLLTAPPESGTATNTQPLHQQRDLLDVIRTIGPGHRLRQLDTTSFQSGRPAIWVIPQAGYSLQTGFLAQLLGNVAFRRPGANVSTLTSAVSYTQQHQQLWTNTLNYWLPNNAWNLTADVRLMHYPQATFGLGMGTNTDRVVNMDYSYLRNYVTLLRRLTPNFYGGLGLQLDLHWNIDSYNARGERVRISRYTYGVTGRSLSVGPVVNLLYDNRANSINPLGGLFANVVFRQNVTWLGSNESRASMLLDVRKYVPLSRAKPETILAFWSYSALTLNGNPPFLDLPATGWDTYNNTGRGYIQGRFRGKDLLYLETEFRFGITANRLLGGVVFVNAQTVSEPVTPAHPDTGTPLFTRVAPAAGAGIRLRMNKLSRTNLSIDYGRGIEGSHGLFFNLGEVF